jgi:hypothetical protein
MKELQASVAQEVPKYGIFIRSTSSQLKPVAEDI